MLAWIRASFENRSINPASVASVRTFTAATRPVRVFTARYTSPIPPAPRKSTSRKSPTYELSSPALTTMLQMRSAIHPALRILHRSRGAVLISDGVDAHQFLAVANRHRERNRGPRFPLAGGENPGDLTVIVKHRTAAVSAAGRVDGQLVVIAKGAHHWIGRFHLPRWIDPMLPTLTVGFGIVLSV